MHTRVRRSFRVLAEIPTERGADPSPIGRWSSIAAHVILLGLVILAGRHAWKVQPVSTRGGQHSTILYWAGSVGTGIARSHQQGAEKLSPARVTPRNNPVNPSQQKALDPE